MFCSENCKPKVDILSYSRKKKKLSNKDKNAINRCGQPWTADYALTILRAIHHVKVCQYLNIDRIVALEDEYKFNKKSCSSLSLYKLPILLRKQPMQGTSTT